MARANKRSTRLIEMAEFLVGRRRPVKVAELTEHFGINRATIYRMLQELEAELDTPVQRSSDGVWIDPNEYQMSVRLSLNEALVVFLAARLLARYSDKPNPHAVKALNKLSIALRLSAARIAEHIARTSEKLDRPLKERAVEHLRALEELTRAWAAGTRVRLFTRDEPDVERLFEPYFIEPSAVGYSSYVIGYDHYRRAERTFKIERLHRVLPTLDTFTIPATFDPYARLAGAWGVNWGDGQTPAEVVLRFAAGRAADRVRETNWHESQVIDDDPAGGGCVLRITVGSTQEMKPWIRQWGADCEVLAPADLRREIAEEMRRAGEIYAE
jgi:proteasome accessory factor B